MIACSEDGITELRITVTPFKLSNSGDTDSPPSHITELFVQLVRCHHNLSDHGLVCEMCRGGSEPQLLPRTSTVRLAQDDGRGRMSLNRALVGLSFTKR